MLGKKYRIDQVISSEKHFQNNQLFFSNVGFVAEDWHWDGKEMYRIDYGYDHPYSENFFYGSKRRIERTTVPAYNIRSEYFYDGRELEHIDVYDKDELYCKMVFVHDEKKLVEVRCNYYDVSDTTNPILAKSTCPLANLVGGDFGMQIAVDEVQRIGEKMAKGSKNNISVRYEFTWTDDNVTAVKCTDNEGVRNIVLTYDDKINPYSQLYGFRELNDPIFGFEMLSKNNILSIRMPYRNVENQMFRFSYEYDDDCPLRRVLTYSYQTYIVGEFESVDYRVEREENFSYLD